ncbi:MAG: hypothetical protein DBX39_05590 [Bacillota bacterium]|nr:MAG: hypothetical protein DBX39_05590 [Bacillota bacterium]
MNEFFSNIAKAFSDFGAVDFLSILLFAVVFYYVFRVLKMNNVRSVIVVFALFVIVTGIIFASDAKLKGDVFMVIPMVLAGLILVIFNVEVKRDILNLGTLNRLSEKREHQTYASKDEVERYISEIIKALQNLSKDNIGALIILSNDNIPAQVLESGVILDANISSQLIEGIFFVKAPLHDGAMIINNYKIQAAGCFLPLTQNVNIPKELGTRHRAGIGITETTNVIALIVSEETGIITIAQRGKISRYADYDLLKKTLSDYYWKDLSADWRKRI